MVLRHELAHIASGDIALKLFVEIISSVYWWIPFIGALSRQTNAALELRADDLVTKELDESQRLAYLSCLLKVAKCGRRTPSPFAVGLMTGKEGSLKARFRYVLERPRTSPLFHAVALRIWLMGCAGMLSGRIRGSGVGCWVAQGLGEGSVSGAEGVSVAAGSGSVVAPVGG